MKAIVLIIIFIRFFIFSLPVCYSSELANRGHSTLILNGNANSQHIKYDTTKKVVNNIYKERSILNSSLPIYDINNIPISVWLFKDSSANVGFMVAGHAYKAICQIASFELKNEIDRMGAIDTTIFTYGVGFDIRPKTSNQWNIKYDSLLGVMRKNFQKLADSTDQVIVNEIPYVAYLETQLLIKQHIIQANKANQWNKHIIEYKHISYPLIVPFYDINTINPIVFKIPKSTFGVIPVGLNGSDFISDVLSNIDKEIRLITKANKENEIQLNKLLIQNIDAPSHSNDLFWFGFPYEVSEYTKKGIVLKPFFLESYELSPKRYTYKETLNGIVVSERPVTFQEVKQMLNDGQTIISAKDRKDIENYIKKEPSYRNKFNQKKILMSKQIRDIITQNNKVLESIKKIKAEILGQIVKQRKEDYIIIDAFLRGWAFSTESDIQNAKLDKWYTEYRPKVWKTILEKYPKAQNNGKLAGIFHADDVFFKVKSQQDNFIITPYKVIGGDFVQVIDKTVGICTFYTPFNFRHDN